MATSRSSDSDNGIRSEIPETLTHIHYAGIASTHACMGQGGNAGERDPGARVATFFGEVGVRSLVGRLG